VHQHAVVVTSRTRIWVLAVSVPAGPVIGVAAFALLAAVSGSLAWPLGLVALLVAPAFACYQLGCRFGNRELGKTAAAVAVASSVVTAVGLLLLALSRASFG